MAFIFRYHRIVGFGKWGYEDTGLDPSLGLGWRYREATLKLVIEEGMKGKLRQRRGVPLVPWKKPMLNWLAARP